jgi:uncharacterized protein
VSVVYLDASAIVKLIARETESAGLAAYLEPSDQRATSLLSVVEVTRAAAAQGGSSSVRLDEVFERLAIIAIDRAVIRSAASLAPTSLRSLDAIHLASALELGSDLGAFVTYDRRLAGAARLQGLLVESPGQPAE